MKNEAHQNETKINLPPKPKFICVDETFGQVIGYDFVKGRNIHEGKWVRAA